MFPISKLLVLGSLILPLSVGGCQPRKGAANPEDYFPLIQVALAGGETAAMIGRNEFLKNKKFEGCVAANALISALDSAQQALSGKLKDQVVFPAVELDVSECLAFRKETAQASTIFTKTAGMVAVGGAPESSEDSMEDELDSEEEAPSEEEGAFPMETSDAAVLVDAIAGITLAAVTHYAAKLQKANCEKGTAALGAINYVHGMVKPITEEITNPDGKLSIPMVVIDLTECAGV